MLEEKNQQEVKGCETELSRTVDSQKVNNQSKAGEQISGEHSTHSHSHRTHSGHSSSHSSGSHRSHSGHGSSHSSGSHSSHGEHGSHTSHGSGSHSSGTHRSHSTSQHSESSHRKHSSVRKGRRRANGYDENDRITKKPLTKKTKINIACVAVLACLLIAILTVEIVKLAKGNTDTYDKNTGVTANSDMLNVELVMSKNGAGEAYLISESVRQYLNENFFNNTSVIPTDFTASGENWNAQKPVSVKLSTNGTKAAMYKIELSNNSEFANDNGSKITRTDYLEASHGEYTFEHLYANTTYYYRVTAYTESGVISNTGSFKTADTPRLLSIDGVHNVRDIGNWETDSGKRIKQGLLIRGKELDGAVGTGAGFHLTNKGLDDMLNVLGIKYDMDLRGRDDDKDHADALGPQVEHKYYGMVMYDQIDPNNPYTKACMKDIFTDLARPDNYPIYMHCTYGTDRTGIVCYLLEALLGVAKDDCRKDYSLSNNEIDNKSEYNEYTYNMLWVENWIEANCEGETLKEKVEYYLVELCDVDLSDIESIRNIFLGE